MQEIRYINFSVSSFEELNSPELCMSYLLFLLLLLLSLLLQPLLVTASSQVKDK